MVLLEGSDGSFCEGLEIEFLHEQSRSGTHTKDIERILTRFADLLLTIEHTPVPVIAIVDGPAIGGGVGLAAAADLILATSQASFALPESIMGLIPAMVFPFLAHRIGVPKARLMALGDVPCTAAAALQLGLVDDIVEDSERAIRKYARRFSRMDRRALAEIKTLAADYLSMPDHYWVDNAARFSKLLASKETQERLTRFVNGEAPWPEEHQT